MVQGSLSALVMVAIFGLILPKIASYADVWGTIKALTWIEMASLIAATVFNLFTYWWQMQSAMPGLTLGQAAVSNQTSTTVSNLVPGAGVAATGLMYGMFHSWGFTGSEVALLASTTGIWNTFLKLGLPIMAVALLAIMGRATNTLLAPALIGLVFLVGSVVLFAMVLWKKSLARAIGARLGKSWSSIRGLFHKPPVETWGEGAVRFRKQTIGLVVRRWPALTITTVASHLALWFVLLLTLRHVGVSAHEVSTVQVLAVFAFVRLISAIPITPGGLGVVELGLIGGLYAAGRTHTDVPLDEFKVQVTAAALLFRTLTYRGPDPARRLHLSDLAAQEELAETPTRTPPTVRRSRGIPDMRTLDPRLHSCVVGLLVLLAACTGSSSSPPPRSPTPSRWPRSASPRARSSPSSTPRRWRRRGTRSDPVLDAGPRELVQPALAEGLIDVVPEYAARPSPSSHSAPWRELRASARPTTH